MRKNFKSFEEAKLLILLKDIKTQQEFIKWITGNSDKYLIPANPRSYYSEWNGWSNFLSNSNKTTLEKSINFLNYEECRIFLLNNNIKTLRKYVLFRKNYNEILPSNPYNFYYKEWVNYDHFFSIAIKEIDKKRIKFTYSEAKEYLSHFEIYTVKAYLEYIKNNKITFLPTNPKVYYKEFTGYGNYLNNYTKYLPYTDAKIFVKDNNINSCIEYDIWQHKNNYDFLPYEPSHVYKEWFGWSNFLNKSNRSTGESLIEKYLISNNIEYTFQKKFINCKNINSLPFDFYLIDRNTCIEFDGKQHFVQDKFFGGDQNYFEYRQNNDLIKTNYCLNNNIKLIRIPYWDIKRIENILDKEL